MSTEAKVITEATYIIELDTLVLHLSVLSSALQSGVLRLANLSESNGGNYTCGAVGYEATGATLLIVHSMCEAKYPLNELK